MAIHGLPRATKDIDLLILTDDLSRVLLLLKEKGYDIEGLRTAFPMSKFGGKLEDRPLNEGTCYH